MLSESLSSCVKLDLISSDTLHSALAHACPTMHCIPLVIISFDYIQVRVCTYVQLYVAGSPGGWRGVLLTSMSQWECALCGRGSYHEVKGGATSPRSLEPGPIAAGQLQNSAYANRARSRRQVNSSWAIAGRLPLCACRQTVHCMSRQFQAISRGDRCGAAAASVKQTSCSGACRRAETER